MSPEQARQQARALLHSTDSLLSALLTVAQQLRETVAIMTDLVDHAVPEKSFSNPKPPPAEEPPVSMDGLMSAVQLSERLTAAGFPLARATIENYTTRGIIPTCPKFPRKRLYEWAAVLEALRKKKEQEGPPIS